MRFLPHLVRGALGSCALLIACHAGATGVQPDSTIVQLSAADGQAQMAVRNTEFVPLLMNVKVHDLPGSESLTVLPLPQVSRVEANGRQVVRLVLIKPAAEITKQYLKRVSFEGIPPKTNKPGEAVVAFNVRQTIPLVISPKGLEQDPEPWKKLTIVRTASGLEVINDSPFVVRLKSDAELLPMKSGVRLLKDTYVLPGERHAVELPKDVAPGAVQSVRIYPASPWGFAVDAYEIAVSATPVTTAVASPLPTSKPSATTAP